MKIATLLFIVLFFPNFVFAQEFTTSTPALDSDSDGFSDEMELFSGYDPYDSLPIKLEKTIRVSTKEQRLRYYTGEYLVKEIKVSTGLPKTPTPKGEFKIDLKLPVHLYKGANYYFPNTKWNMRFKYHKGGSYYVHGAFWHNAFGTPRSHGCVNVAYADMEGLYNWTPMGTRVIID